MSFVWKRPEGRQATPEQIADRVWAVAEDRGLDDLAAVMALMCISVESDFWCPANHADPESFSYQHDSISDDNRSVGYFQQQKGPHGEEWWGSTHSMMTLETACDTFLDRLTNEWHTAAGNPTLAGQMIADVQQCAVQYRYRYSEEWERCWALFNRAIDGVEPPPTGDPVWLPDVLRAEGLTVEEYPGWRGRGHGDFDQIWGVMVHHTGSDNTPTSEIASHPRLGLCSQLHLARDGVVTVVGAGVAWHAGAGDWPGLPRDGANQLTIGIEAQNRGGPGPNAPVAHRSCWPDVQYNAYVRCVAAILRHLGVDADHVISHKDWAGSSQGKYDPGQIDMGQFRKDVQAQIDSKEGGAEMTPEQDRMLREVHKILTHRIRSKSIYRTPGGGTLWQALELVHNDDKFLHEDFVEQAARRGQHWAIDIVAKVAAGVGDDTGAEAVAQATAALSEVPVEHLHIYREGLGQ